MTTEEAMELINLFKRLESGTFKIPIDGKMEYNFLSTSTRSEFKVNVYRVTKASKISYSGLLKGKNIMLIRLDITPNGKHRNPDGEIIEGNHLHIYSEEYGDRFAISFNSDNDDVFDNCLDFFEMFNIIDTKIDTQISLFN